MGGGIYPISQPKFCLNPISQPDFWPNPSPSGDISGKSKCMENQSENTVCMCSECAHFQTGLSFVCLIVPRTKRHDSLTLRVYRTSEYVSFEIRFMN